MKIFVNGATGVVGRRAVPQLLELGHDITGMARSAAKADALRKAGARPTTADLFEKPTLREAVAGHEAVINLATHMPSLNLSAFLPGAWAENDRVRSVGSANLAEAAIAGGVRVFVQESFAPRLSGLWRSVDRRNGGTRTGPVQPDACRCRALGATLHRTWRYRHCPAVRRILRPRSEPDH